MFTNLSIRAAAEIDTLRQILRAHEALREALFPSLPAAVDSEPALVLQLRAAAPQKKDWRIHDHCSAVMRLYAIFEQCIEDLVGEYLEAMPSLFPVYEELPTSTITQHRIGVAHILQRLGKDGHYADHLEADVLAGITAGNSKKPYTLFIDAFLIDPQNYRVDLINKVFKTLGFDDIWAGAVKHQEVCDFMQTRDPNESPRELLKKIVDERNLATHSRLTNVWGASEMIAMSTFIEVIAKAICEIVERASLLRRRDVGLLLDVGKVIHKFRENVCGVELGKTSIANGDTLIAIDSKVARAVKVVSLRKVHDPVLRYDAAQGDRIGVCFDCGLAKGTLLLREGGTNPPTSDKTVQAGSRHHPVLDELEQDEADSGEDRDAR